jgi:hypothetical protein
MDGGVYDEATYKKVNLADYKVEGKWPLTCGLGQIDGQTAGTVLVICGRMFPSAALVPVVGLDGKAFDVRIASAWTNAAWDYKAQPKFVEWTVYRSGKVLDADDKEIKVGAYSVKGTPLTALPTKDGVDMGPLGVLTFAAHKTARGFRVTDSDACDVIACISLVDSDA